MSRIGYCKTDSDSTPSRCFQINYSQLENIAPDNLVHALLNELSDRNVNFDEAVQQNQNYINHCIGMCACHLCYCRRCVCEYEPAKRIQTQTGITNYQKQFRGTQASRDSRMRHSFYSAKYPKQPSVSSQSTHQTSFLGQTSSQVPSCRPYSFTQVKKDLVIATTSTQFHFPDWKSSNDTSIVRHPYRYHTNKNIKFINLKTSNSNYGYSTSPEKSVSYKKAVESISPIRGQYPPSFQTTYASAFIKQDANTRIISRPKQLVQAIQSFKGQFETVNKKAFQVHSISVKEDSTKELIKKLLSLKK